MRKHMLKGMIPSVLFLSGCSSVANLMGAHIGKDYEPLTPLTPEEWKAVNEVEARVPLAVQKFGRPAFKVRPQITVVSSPDQKIPRFGKSWKDVHWGGVEPRVEGEGYSGLWLPPDLYVSTIGDRAAHFKKLYAHERAHSFFERGSGHPALFFEIERFLLE